MDEDPGRLENRPGVVLRHDAPEAAVAGSSWRPLAGRVMTVPERPPRMPRFRPGAKVRVRHGVLDSDFPDIPSGGWTGRVKEVEQAKGQITYLIACDRRTLRGIHPVHRKRCEQDALEFVTMWLGDEELEPDEGEPIPIEQSTTIQTQPSSEKDQDDRVRMGLGLTHDDALPEVSRRTLMAYYRYPAA